MGYGRSKLKFLDQFGGPGSPEIGPNWTKMPKMAKNSQNVDLKVLVVPNGWNSVERSWNGLWEVQVKVFEPIWWSGAPSNLAQRRPKMAQIGQNGNLKVPVVPNGWNSVEQSWNGI